MQDSVCAEILAQVAVERREGMCRGKALFEQQTHRVAFVAEGRLHADEDIAELRAEHEDRGAVALLAAGSGTPLPFNLVEPAFAAHMGVGGNPGVYVGVCTEPLAIAVDDPGAQLIDGGGHIHRIAFALHGAKRHVKRGKDRQVRSRAGVAGIGREVEQHDRHLTLGAFGAPQPHQTVDARRQHFCPFDAGMHVAVVVAGGEGAAAMAAGAGLAGVVGSAAEHDRAGGAVKFGNRHHDRRFDWQQAAVGRPPLLQRLQFGGVAGDIRHIEPRQHILGRTGVIIRRAADQ